VTTGLTLVPHTNDQRRIAERLAVLRRARAGRHSGRAGDDDGTPPYTPYGGAAQVIATEAPEVLIAGPAGTGKSLACLQKWHGLARACAGARGLLLRKTGTSLAGSGVVTFERDVLGPTLGGPVLYQGATPRRPPRYLYRNGSSLVIGGLDKPDKVLSSDYDWIYWQEATEGDEREWEILTTRLRTGVLPYQQIVGDCNPDSPTHWLYQRSERGALLRIESRHEDNPRYWDRTAATWTAEGERYVLGVLGNLSGLRRERLRFGRWTAAEGVIYEGWDARIHVVDLLTLRLWGIVEDARDDGTFALGPAVRRCWASLDWGFTHAGVLQLWAEDGDGRLYRLHEVYQTERLIDWWIARAQTYRRVYRPQSWFCDPSEPAYIRQFQQAGLNAAGANNAVRPGIDAVAARLASAGDGRPRLFVLRAEPDAADPTLIESKRAWCLEQEITSYVWDQRAGRGREQPLKEADHACDALRYLVATRDLDRPGRGRVY